jgi:O-acetyl-ADP-ribose deacetylase (regulator of RNase III)
MDDMFHVGKVSVRLVLGDITKIASDAIVNAANSTLLGGGGVDGAIHRRGGPRILEECRKIRMTEWPNGLPTGKVVATMAGELRARFVFHAVGPVWYGGSKGEPQLLRQAYSNCLKLAVSRKLNTIAFPSISTGAYGYPIEKACCIALLAVKDFLEQEDCGLKEIIFVLHSDSDFQIYKSLAKEIFSS